MCVVDRGSIHRDPLNPKNISITSKKLFKQKSLLTSPLTPELYTSPKNINTCTFITDTSIIRYKYYHRAKICFLNKISVKFMIIFYYYDHSKYL